MKRFLIYLVALTLCLSALTGCKKAEEESVPEETSIESSESSVEVSESSVEESSESSVEESSVESSVEESSEESSEVVVEIDPSSINPLTGEVGEAGLAYKRPVAIMINNHAAAVPQLGISEADILLELIVEGGITRFMAIYQELPEDIAIGSVRSLRHNYLDFSEGFDAVVVHCGSSNIAEDALYYRDVDDVDAIYMDGSLFYRDSWRIYNMGYEHSLCVNSSDLQDYLDNRSFSMEHDEDYQCNMVFSEAPVLAEASELTDVTVDFGTGKYTYFSYDPETGLYTGSQYGDSWYDMNTEGPVLMKNLLVIQTAVWVCDGAGHQDMTLTGEGNGWFMVNGQMAEITWSREGESDQFTYTYADGTPVEFGIGKTYIAVVNNAGGVY